MPDVGRIAKLNSAIQGEPTRGQFKTPSLRNVAERTAFLHLGRIATLNAAVARYASLPSYARQDARADPLVSSVEVSLGDVDDLAAFLQTQRERFSRGKIRSCKPAVHHAGTA